MDIKNYIALFDLDGVILDTEADYTKLWNSIGKKYLNIDDFGIKIKGQTLVKILNDYFPNPSVAQQVTNDVHTYEKDMEYAYIPGAENFLDDLKARGVRCAVVTSSDLQKMSNVFRNHPDFKDKFEYILTSEDFTKSKPAPECYLKGMKMLNSDAEHTIVFEDSISGIQSGRGSGAIVVGLSTTNPVEVVKPLSDFIISDFCGHKFDEFIK